MSLSLGLQQYYHDVLEQIHQACQCAGRELQQVQLLAVSKTKSAQQIQQLYDLGQRAFGENYVQEAIEKITQLADLEIEWHFIGHVQRNKTKLLAEHFAWVQGVDKLIIAQRLSNQRASHQAPLNICLQVNIDNEQSKDGCMPSEVEDLVKQISELPNIRLRGLMVIPAPNNKSALVDAKKLFDDVRQYHAHADDWDTLSMGMSGDMQQAIANGSTMVRVGTALFGARDYHIT